MKQFSLTCAALLIAIFAWAGTGAIQGQVFLDEDGQLVPAAFANVSYDYMGVTTGVTTDIEGRFIIKPLEAGLYSLAISYVGYQKRVIENIRVNPDKITRMEATELVSGVGLPPVVITGHRVPLINAEDPTAMTILAAEIQKSPQMRNPGALIASTTPGVYQQDEGQPVYFRGARAGSVVYFVDGVKTRDGSLGVPSTAIGSLTVYTGGVPAAYGDLIGGAVIVETKSFFELYNARQR